MDLWFPTTPEIYRKILIISVRKERCDDGTNISTVILIVFSTYPLRHYWFFHFNNDDNNV
jgi:hypothetical protein